MECKEEFSIVCRINHLLTQFLGGHIMLEDKRIKLLIADDNKEFCNLIVEFFEGEQDIKIIGVAHDGLEALEKIEELEPEVLILDLIMPNLDGLGVIERLADKTKRPKIVVLPPIPVSISSNIRQDILSTSAIILFNANIIREDSPPDMIFTRGFSGSPGFVDIKNSISSIPSSFI